MSRASTSLTAFSLVAAAVLVSACGHAPPWQAPHPGWQRISSAHFTVTTDADEDDYTSVLDRLEDVHEALSRSFFEGVSIDRAEVLLFGRRRDFKGVVPRPTWEGFYDGKVLVFPVDADPDVVASVAAHELAHHFVHALEPRTPPWVHEGFAKSVGGIQFYDDLAMFDMHWVQGYAIFNEPVPLRALLGANVSRFHGKTEEAHYMTSWMLVRLLLATGSPGEGRGRFKRFVHAMATAPDAAVAARRIEEIFGSSLDAIEAELTAEHQAMRQGVGQKESRRTGAVRVSREGRLPPTKAPADLAAVKALCEALRAARSPEAE